MTESLRKEEERKEFSNMEGRKVRDITTRQVSGEHTALRVLLPGRLMVICDTVLPTPPFSLPIVKVCVPMVSEECLGYDEGRERAVRAILLS